MFRPTLKRSKLESNLIKEPTPKTIKEVKQNRIHYIPTQNTNAQKITILPQFLVEQPKYICRQNKTQIITPLSSQQRQYPAQILRGMNENIHQLDGRGVGYAYGVYWFFIRRELFLWNYDEEIPSKIKNIKRMEVDSLIYSINIGNIRGVEKKFKKNQFLLLALGQESIITLIQIDQQTLDFKGVLCKIAVDGGQALQTVKFTMNNEIFYAGNCAYLGQVSFSEDGIKKYIHRPYKGLNSFKSRNISVQNIIVGEERVFCLVRKDSEESWMRYKCRSVWNFIKGKVKEHAPKHIINKQIHVYKRDAVKGLVFEKLIENTELEKALKENYSSFLEVYKEESQFSKAFFIVSIYAKKGNNKQHLGIVTREGYNILLNIDENQFTFVEKPEQLEGKVLLDEEQVNLIKNYRRYKEVQPNLTKNIIFSTGAEGLTVNNENCVYNDGKVKQIIKLNQIPGHITQGIDYEREKKNSTDKWVIFEKTSFTILKKMGIQEIILTYMIAYEELVAQKHINQYQLYYEFERRIEKIGEIVGKVQLCHCLYKLISYFILRSQKSIIKQLPLMLDLKMLAKSQIQERQIIKYKDWYYKVGKLPPNQGIQITKERGLEFWKLLFTYHHHLDNVRVMNKNPQEGIGTSWWICLRQKFYFILEPIMKWNPKKFVLEGHKKIVLQVIQKLQIMLQMIYHKKRLSKKVTQDLLFIRNRIEEEKKRKQKQVSTMTNVFKNNLINITHDDSLNLTEQTQKNPYIITQSMDQLQNILLNCIHKVISSIKFFQILSECDKSSVNSLPVFQSFLVQIKSRQFCKKVLIESFGRDIFDKTDLVKKFNNQIPELKFDHEKFFHEYFSENPKFRFSYEEFDAIPVAEKLNLDKIIQVEQKFINHPYKYVQIMLYRILYLESQIKFYQIQSNTRSQQKKQFKNTIELGIQKSYIELKEIAMQQKEDLSTFIVHFIQNYARETHQTKGDEFPIKQSHFERILDILIGFKDQFYMKQLEKYLIEQKILPQKLLKMRMKTPKQTYPMSATSQMLKIQGPAAMDSIALMGLQEARFKNNFAKTPSTPEDKQ